MSKKVYRSMQGREVDLDALRMKNELTVAVGNADMNARGDKIGQGGKILKKREEAVAEYYEGNPNAKPRENAISEVAPKVTATTKSEGKKK